MTGAATPGVGRTLGRGLVRHCPHCGSGHLFEGWFRLRERCPRCGMRFERQEGFMLGSMTINTIVTFVSVAVVVAGAMIATWPDVPMWPVMGLGAVAAIAIPALVFPFSVTIWAAAELAMRPLEPDELADAAAHAAPGWGDASGEVA